MSITKKFWYPEVINDLDQIGPALDYYRAMLLEGQQELPLKGHLQSLLEKSPGLVRHYADASTDCAMIWKWLEEEIKHEKAKKRLFFQRDPEIKELYGDLKKTDIDVLVQADSDIKALIDLQLMIELWKNCLAQLIEQLKSRSITLAVISKVREAGEQEAFIDSTKHTNPETLS